MLSDPAASMTELADVIKGDPGLTASVLHAANAAASRARKPIATAVDAIIRIGFEHTKQIVGAAVVGDAFEGLEESGLEVEEFWKHSVATAVIAEVAVDDPRQRPLAFTAVLLHDVGRLVLAQSHPARYRRVVLAARKGAPAAAAEQVIFGVDHAAVGGAAAQRWGLAAELVTAIADHHAGTANGLARAVFRARGVLNDQQISDGVVFLGPRALADGDGSSREDRGGPELLRLVGGKAGLDAKVAVFRTAASALAKSA